MLSRLLLLAVCLLSLQDIFSAPLATAVQTAPAPGWVTQINPPGSSRIKGEDVSDGYLYRLRDVQYYLPSQTRFVHLIRKIYSGAGVQQASEIEVTYDPSYEKLVFHEIKIWRAGRVINKLEPAKFKVFQRETSKESFIYDGSRSALLILEDVRVDDEIEYSYSIAGYNPIYEGKFATTLYLGHYDPADLVSYRIVTPPHVQISSKPVQTSLHPQIVRNNNLVEYLWYQENVSGTPVENDVPGWYNPYPHVLISQYTSWQEVTEWARRLYFTPTAMSAGLQKFIQDLKQAGIPQSRQIEQALQFVQNEIRYTGLEAGIGAYKPRSPSIVFDQRFGDCKDKSLLLCFILRELGLEAYPALVNADTRHTVKDALPAPQAFNHCITWVQLKGQSYWYDPTISHQGGNYQNRFLPNYGYALVVREGSSDLTPIETRNPASTNVEETFTLKRINGPARLSIVTEYYGRDADHQRYYFDQSTLREMEKNYLNYNAKNYPKIKVAEPLKFIDDRQQNKLITFETYEIKDFWTAPDSSRPEAIECTAYPQMLRDKLFMPDTKIRHSPMHLEYPLNLSHTLHFQLPEAWTVEQENQTITGPGIRFTSNISYQNQHVTVKYTYETEKDHLTAEESNGFIQKQNQIIGNLGYMLTYNQEPEHIHAAAGAMRVNWLMVLLALLFSGIVALAAVKAFEYDPLPEVDYRHEGREFGGWLVVFLLGIVLAPLLQLTQIFDSSYFNWRQWDEMTNPVRATYYPIKAALLVARLLFTIFLGGFSVLLVILCFQRRSSVPDLITVYNGAAAAFAVLEALLIKPENGSYYPLLVTLASAAIWISYFRLSVRVKETFIHTLDTPENAQQIYRGDF